MECAGIFTLKKIRANLPSISKSEFEQQAVGDNFSEPQPLQQIERPGP
jgi:hypothetical protein